MVSQCFLLGLQGFLEHSHGDNVAFGHCKVIVGVVLITWLGEIILQAKDDVFMILLGFAIGGVVKIFDLSKLDRRKLLGVNLVSLEELFGLPNVECDVVR